MKLRLPGLTVAAPASRLVTLTVTVPIGCVAGITVKVPVPPSTTVRLIALSVRTGRLTQIVNVNVSASLAAVLSSESVTFHVHGVGPHAVLGVPLIRFLARSYVTPPGR